MPYRSNPLETLLTALAGWLPMLAGMGLLAMVLVTPAWMGWRELLWQRDMVRLQAESLAVQRVSYAEFNEALVADDPVLLERLAFTHLRYKPTGKRLLDGVIPGVGDPDVATVSGPRAQPSWSANGEVVGGAGVSGGSEMIGHWLASPQPAVGRDIAPLKPINTRLTRLASGPSRFVLMAVGLICLLAGLWPECEEAGGQSGGEAEAPTITFRMAMTRREGWGPLRLGRRLFSTSQARRGSPIRGTTPRRAAS